MNKKILSKFFNFSATMILAVFLLSCIETVSSSNDPSSSGSNSGGSGGSEPNRTFEGPAPDDANLKSNFTLGDGSNVRLPDEAGTSTPDGIMVRDNLVLREVANVLLSSEAGTTFRSLANMEIGENNYLLVAGDRGLNILRINDETANRSGNFLALERILILGTDGNLYDPGNIPESVTQAQMRSIEDVATQTIGSQQYIFLVQKFGDSYQGNPTPIRSFTIDSNLDITRASADIAGNIRANNHTGLINTTSIHLKIINATTYLFATGYDRNSSPDIISRSISVFRMAADTSLNHIQDLSLGGYPNDPSIVREISIGGSEYLELKETRERFFSIAADGRLTPAMGNYLGTVDASRLIGGGNASPFIITTDGSDYVFFIPQYISVNNALVLPSGYQLFEVIGSELVEIRMPNNQVALRSYNDIFVTETMGGRHYIFSYFTSFYGDNKIRAVEFVTQFSSTAN